MNCILPDDATTAMKSVRVCSVPSNAERNMNTTKNVCGLMGKRTMADINDGLTASDSAVAVDMHVRTGTANVMTEKQWTRTLYSGTGLCNCQMTLKPGESATDNNTYSFLCIMTNTPVSVVIIDASSAIVKMKVNRILLLDDTVSGIVIANDLGADAEAVNANVSVTKLK